MPKILDRYITSNVDGVRYIPIGSEYWRKIREPHSPEHMEWMRACKAFYKRQKVCNAKRAAANKVIAEEVQAKLISGELTEAERRLDAFLKKIDAQDT